MTKKGGGVDGNHFVACTGERAASKDKEVLPEGDQRMRESAGKQKRRGWGGKGVPNLCPTQRQAPFLHFIVVAALAVAAVVVVTAAVVLAVKFGWDFKTVEV